MENKIENQIVVLHKYQDDNKDNIEIGTPSKGGAIKIYGNFTNTEDFKIKVDKAFEVRKYAQSKMETSG